MLPNSCGNFAVTSVEQGGADLSRAGVPAEDMLSQSKAVSAMASRISLNEPQISVR